MDIIWFYVFLLLGFGFALLIGYFGLHALLEFQNIKQKLESSQCWERGEGRILTAEVERDVRRDENGKSVTYIPHVKYVYQVDGHNYEGDQIGFGTPKFSMARKANAIVDQYPVGGQISFFYNPLDPSEAVLDRVIFRPNAYLVIGISMILVMLIMIGLLIFWWRSENQALLIQLFGKLFNLYDPFWA
jgi:hypothetical protein